jgi:hypothetical protein
MDKSYIFTKPSLRREFVSPGRREWRGFFPSVR